MSESKQISLLLVSDLHNKLEVLQQLTSHCKKVGYKPDYIICTGDHVTLSQGGKGDQEVISSAEKEIASLLLELENICDKVIYIPGNHDTSTMFTETPVQLTPNSVNLHMKSYRLDDDLLLLGVGGSISNPLTPEVNIHKYKIDNWDNIAWKGYPHINDANNPLFKPCDELFGTALNKAWSSLDQNDNSKVILLTHNGPFSCDTANAIWEGTKVVYSGSIELDEFLVSHQDRIIANIHGHTHKGKGMGKVFNTDIINVGDTQNKHYGKVLLVKDRSTKYQWKIKRIDRCTLTD